MIVSYLSSLVGMYMCVKGRGLTPAKAVAENASMRTAKYFILTGVVFVCYKGENGS